MSVHQFPSKMSPPGSESSYNESMNTPTREEIEARLQATEARVDARLGAFEKTMAESLAAMRVDIADMKTTLVKEIGSVAQNVSRLEGEVGGVKTVTNWTLVLVGIAIAAATLWATLRQPSTPAAPQPIIIQVPSTPAK